MKFLITFLVFPLNYLYGQIIVGPKQLKKEGRFAYLVGMNYSTRIKTAEIGIVRGWRASYQSKEMEMPALQLLYFYSNLSSEVSIVDTDLVFCPKLGYHAVYGMLHVGLNTLTYTNFVQTNFGIRPEVGLSFGGIFGISYGYNLMTNYESKYASNHVFLCRIILKSGLFCPSKR